MSEILIGRDANNPEQSTVLPDTPEQKAKQLPEIDGVFESGIVKADITKTYEERLTTVLFVVELGPDCYKDTTRFPSGAWCKKGDFVLIRPNTGSRLKIHNREFRIINDDAIEGIVEDPRGIARA